MTMTDRGDEDLSDVDLSPDPVLNTSFPGLDDAPCLAKAITFACLPFWVFPCQFGCFQISEKRHSAVLYFGKYVGSVQNPGIHFLTPFGLEMRPISTATRTMDMKNLKVVDSRGNPVIVSAVVTFVATSARKARIDVENPWPNASWQPGVQSGTYLQLQSQAVLKQITSQFPYEAQEGFPSLQTEGRHITELLMSTLQKRVAVTGAQILSFDLVDLSYAPEIAQNMLVRQQAAALVDARKLIVEAAVEMTHSATEALKVKKGRDLSEKTEDAIMINLLTVVCSNEAVTPTISVGDPEAENNNEAVTSLARSVASLVTTMQATQGS
jgi:regulator of protease activity HflC (stomatin/prohibitin superfamily)